LNRSYSLQLQVKEHIN